jgi:hypothetical protein
MARNFASSTSLKLPVKWESPAPEEEEEKIRTRGEMEKM